VLPEIVANGAIRHSPKSGPSSDVVGVDLACETRADRGEGDAESQQRGDGKQDHDRHDPVSADTDDAEIHEHQVEQPETIEEASQRERSKLDYRNVKSNLTPAQKDLLNQDPIPFEQRQFVKEYMESVRR
jgi:hypothetical protein